MLDADAHLYMWPEEMADILAPIGRDWVVDMLTRFRDAESYEADRLRAEEEIWKVKGLAAFGSYQPDLRVKAMDKMGVARQLAFPNTLGRESRLDSPEARAVVRRYNDWCLEWTRGTGGRSIGVCELNLHDRDWALAEVRRLADAGARAVALPMAAPPAGTSPASPVWDELWEVLEGAGITACIHIGGCGQFTSEPGDPIMVDRAWWDAPALRSPFPEQPGAEERIGPVWTILAPILVEIALLPIVMGGVFERFPRLRFGVIEFGAQWLGPLVERMDMHAALMAKVGTGLPMKPSEYVRRNVRCTPFWSEPVDRYIDRYGLEEVYCFSTDFPHVEGGKDPVGRFHATLDRLGPSVVEGFFARNAELLLPA
jgi:predicted TIM-barrel fold metal-dependent hydrolase